FRGHSDVITDRAFSPDGSRVVTASGDETARIWDAETGATVVELKGHANIVRTAAFSSDGSRIVTVSSDGTARVWNAKTGVSLFTIKVREDSVHAVFSVDGSRLIIVGPGGSGVWDATTGREIPPGGLLPATVRPRVVSPDGRNFIHRHHYNAELIPLKLQA